MPHKRCDAALNHRPIVSRALGGLVATLGAMNAQIALANPTSGDDLFHAGKALLAQGRVAEACERLAESYALAPRGGTLLNLAICRETQGWYATAMRLLVQARDAAATGKRADRVARNAAHSSRGAQVVVAHGAARAGGNRARALDLRKS